MNNFNDLYSNNVDYVSSTSYVNTTMQAYTESIKSTYAILSSLLTSITKVFK